MSDGPTMLWRLRSNRDRTSCMQTLRLLQSYIDGRLEAPTSRRVANHLAECRRCGLEADTYLRIKSAMQSQAPLDDAAIGRLRAFADELAAGGGTGAG